MCGCHFKSRLFEVVLVALSLDQLLSALPAFMFAVSQTEQEITWIKVPALCPTAYSKLCVCVHALSQ